MQNYSNRTAERAAAKPPEILFIMNTEKFYLDGFKEAERKEGIIKKEVHRGDVFYYSFSREETGSEQNGYGNGRPCVIVSNEKNNEFSPTVCIVPITSKEKKPLPTHVFVDIGSVYGTALAEQVTTISKERLTTFCGELDEKILKELNKAISVQLDIFQPQDKEYNTITPPPDCELGDDDILRRLKAAEDEMNKYKYLLCERLLKRRL